MSIHRWNARRDDNEPDVVKALRGAGCLVERMAKPLDLLVWSPFLKTILVVEVKDPKRTQRSDRKAQNEFIAEWQAKGALVVRVTSVENALTVVGANDDRRDHG